MTVDEHERTESGRTAGFIDAWIRRRSSAGDSEEGLTKNYKTLIAIGITFNLLVDWQEDPPLGLRVYIPQCYGDAYEIKQQIVDLIGREYTLRYEESYPDFTHKYRFCVGPWRESARV